MAEVRAMCWRWQEVDPVTASTVDGRVDVVGERLTFSCECGGDGCPFDPRLPSLERRIAAAAAAPYTPPSIRVGRGRHG